MQRLPGLDILRGIAALAVVLYHFDDIAGSGDLLPRGDYAVEFFFCLSGFVMARTYEGRMPRPADFLWARWLRFLPMMAVGALIGGCILLVDQPVWFAVAQAACAITLIPLPSTLGLFAANPPAWSIQIELIANALHSAVFERLPTIGLLAVWLGSLIWLLSGAPSPNDILGSQSVPIRPFLSYLIGIALFRVSDRLPTVPFVVAPMLLLAGMILPVPVWAFSIVIAPAVVWFGTGRVQALPLLGAMSFPLYAVHYPVMMGTITFELPLWFGVALSLGLAALLTKADQLAPNIARRRLPVTSSGKSAA